MDLDSEELMALAFATNFAVGHMLHLSSLPEGSDGKILRCQERDCLQWAAEGKTDWEISLILGISRNTVIKHLQSAWTKLDTLNKFQTVAKALRLKLIR